MHHIKLKQRSASSNSISKIDEYLYNMNGKDNWIG